MKPQHFSADVRTFLKLLSVHEVRYLLVGGTAVIYHGYARLTGDVDFYYQRTSENVEQLWAALVEFWTGIVPGIEGPSDLLDPDVVVQFGRPPNRIDLISDLPSVPFDRAWDRRVEDSIDDPAGAIPIHIIGRLDLLDSKREAGRPKDLDDIENLTG